MWDRFRKRDANVDTFKVRLGDGAEITLTGTSSVTPEPIDSDYLPTSIDLPVPANAVRLPRRVPLSRCIRRRLRTA